MTPERLRSDRRLRKWLRETERTKAGDKNSAWYNSIIDYLDDFQYHPRLHEHVGKVRIAVSLVAAAAAALAIYRREVVRQKLLRARSVSRARTSRSGSRTRAQSRMVSVSAPPPVDVAAAKAKFEALKMRTDAAIMAIEKDVRRLRGRASASGTKKRRR